MRVVPQHASVDGIAQAARARRRTRAARSTRTPQRTPGALQRARPRPLRRG
jgi:hypothetical protein